MNGRTFSQNPCKRGQGHHHRNHDFIDQRGVDVSKILTTREEPLSLDRPLIRASAARARGTTQGDRDWTELAVKLTDSCSGDDLSMQSASTSPPDRFRKRKKKINAMRIDNSRTLSTRPFNSYKR